MHKLPSKIAETFEQLKNRLPFRLSLKLINGKYYLYKESARWDKGKKRPIVKSEYLGTVLEDGTFVAKKIRRTDDLSAATAIIVAHGGKVSLPGSETYKTNTQSSLKINDVENTLLTVLSMDARIKNSTLLKKYDLEKTQASIYRQRKGIEKKHGIVYVPELNTEKLGYLSYLTLIKFKKEKPTLNEIKDSLSTEPRIQLALNVTGKYDLLISFLAKSNDEAGDIIYDLRSKTALENYSSEWLITPFNVHYGNVPIRKEFIEFLTNLLKKSKKNINLTQRECTVLSELCRDGRLKFSSIDNAYKLDHGASLYAYAKLKERGIIERMTINMRNLSIRYAVIALLNVVDQREYNTTKKNLMFDITSTNKHPCNRYSISADIGTPNGVLLAFPVYSTDELEDYENFLRKNVRGVEVEILVVSDILVGDFCYRRFDNYFSQQNKALINRYGLKTLKPVYKAETNVSENAIELDEEEEI